MSNEPSPPSNAEGQRPAMERGGLWGLFFSTAGLLLPPYGVLLSVFGIAQGRRARIAAKANNSQAPGALTSMIIGGVGVAFSLLVIAGQWMFWDEYSQFQDCSARAHTQVSQSECDKAFNDRLVERYPQLEGQLPTGLTP